LLLLAASALALMLLMVTRRDPAQSRTAQATQEGTAGAPVRVFGVVRRAEGVAAGARVLASTYLEGVGLLEWTARTDASGTYRLDLDQPGTYSFSTSYKEADPGPAKAVQIPAAAEFELDLDIVMGSIAGRVLGPDDAPVRALLDIYFDPKVTTGRSDRVSRSCVTEETGVFNFEFLPAGVYAISVVAVGVHPDDDRAQLARETVSGLHLPEGGFLRDLQIRMSRGGRVEGFVRRSDGHPVELARVFVCDDSGTVETNGLTDDRGHYIAGPIQVGTWTVSAQFDDQVGLPGTKARVLAGKTARVDLELVPGTNLKVQVSGGGDAAVRAEITVVDQAGRKQLVYGELESDGITQSVGPLAPGTYTVTATRRGGEQVSEQLSLSGEASRSVQLRFTGN
jgi:hypothetical protein